MAPVAPTDVPQWANLATVPDDLDEPTQERRDNGWPGLLPPAHETFNWWMNLVGLWTQFMSQTSRVFDNLGTAVAFADTSLAAGDLLTVFEDDNDIGAGVTQILLLTAAGVNSGLIDASGGVVAVAEGSIDPRLYDRSLNLIATLSRTNAGSNRAIRTDGTVTVLAYGNFVEAFDLTGASIWIFDLGSVQASDLCMTAGSVYVTHPITTLAGDVVAARQMHKIALVNGSFIWDYQHSLALGLNSVATNGRQVFVAGPASTFASAATLRAIAVNGTDAAGEGGNGTDLDGRAWDATPTELAGNHMMDCDGFLLYVGSPIAAVQIVAYGQADGTPIWTYTHPDAGQSVVHISVDQDFVYATYANATLDAGFMHAHDRRNGVPVWRFGAPSGGGVAAGIATVSDGFAVWYLGSVDDNNIRRLTRGNVPTKVRVVDADTELVRFRNWKLQPDAQ